jgi:uncharacterized protein (DUF58 family)
MIPESVMRELRYIEVYTAKRIRNLRVGPYTSPQRGPGFDFDEHQPYRQGDDVRRIDWNVTARLNAPYVRHTHAERELNVMIAMDVSRSMALPPATRSETLAAFDRRCIPADCVAPPSNMADILGRRALSAGRLAGLGATPEFHHGLLDRTKQEVMMFITASLLFSAVSDQINTGFLAFADRVLEHSPPRRSRASAWAVLERCWALSPRPGRTALLPAIRHLLSTLKRTSVVFIVSDFITDEDVFRSPELSMLAAKHDTIAVVPIDRSEMALPDGTGYMQMRDVETGREVAVTLSRRTRRAYADEMRARRETLAHAFYRVPMDHVFVPAGSSPVEPLLSLFAARMAR